MGEILVRISNALARDEPRMMLDHRDIMPDLSVSTAAALHRFGSPVACVFVSWGTATAARLKSGAIVIRGLGPDGIPDYRVGDDVAGFPLAASNGCRLPCVTDPLTRAVDYGSRRCVQALVQSGAQPAPSIEALLVVALDRLLWESVIVVDCQTGHGLSNDVPIEWGPPTSRAVDLAGIVGDLLKAFARSSPISHLDMNPLSALRATVSSNDRLGRVSPIGSINSTARLVGQIRQTVDALLRAGYSPDEPVASLPQRSSIYGGLLDHRDVSASCVDGFALDACAAAATEPDGSIRRRRMAAVRITERQAAAAAHAVVKMRSGGYGLGGDLVEQGMDAIRDAYAGVAPCKDSVDAQPRTRQPHFSRCCRLARKSTPSERDNNDA
jgi:hypothetical protein